MWWTGGGGFKKPALFSCYPFPTFILFSLSFAVVLFSISNSWQSKYTHFPQVRNVLFHRLLQYQKKSTNNASLILDPTIALILNFFNFLIVSNKSTYLPFLYKKHLLPISGKKYHFLKYFCQYYFSIGFRSLGAVSTEL